ncbi:uncharacterized protein [Maniola hyperantus]|uniref:uncharacterized protein n=1 Tax=Aphantopus hyperantus TaxID=2795564 RepID=UPI003747AC4F
MWTTSLCLTVTFIVIHQIGCISSEGLPEDATLDSIGLATKYGHPPTQYDVFTEDGYILTLYRLRGKGSIPILITHGLIDSSDTWMLRGYNSLAITLANRGHDVWLANTRGNRYGRRHQKLNPDTDPAFWNFTFHEMGYYDLPAIIDLVLKETGAERLTAIGHSLGNTIFYVLGSERPEYNSKINVMIALSPIAFLHNARAPVSILIDSYPIISGLFNQLGINDFLGDNTTMGRTAHALCSTPTLGYTLCGDGAIFALSGYDNSELEPDFFRTVASHFPAGISSMTPLHFFQVGYRKTFAQYDHGSETNQKIYNSSEPPVYRLDRVTMPIALFAAANDGYSSLADVEILRGKLPNVVYYLLNPRLSCNHIDYMWGRTVSKYLYPYINTVLNRYNPFALEFIIIQKIGCVSADLPEDATMDTVELATKYGHPPKQYDVVTEDGYILTLYRLPGGSSIPILLVHGLQDSSDTWMLRGPRSLAITLAEDNNDVWLANSRGNRYSRRHKYLSPDTDLAFWQFSFHEMGYYDLPAIIDTILNETNAKNLTAIGHSQGNTMFYVLGSERNEYNSKINVLIALAPVAYLHNAPPPLLTFIKLFPLLKIRRMDESVGDNSTRGRFLHTICMIPYTGYITCANKLLFPLMGLDPEELEPEFFPIPAAHFPAGGSTLSVLHFLQVGYRKTFAPYDHGRLVNMKIYNTSDPPEYKLDQVAMPIALLAGRNDGLSSIADVAILKKQLPNVVYYLENPRRQMNHVNYMWGRNMQVYLYPYIYRVLRENNHYPKNMLVEGQR